MVLYHCKETKQIICNCRKQQWGVGQTLKEGAQQPPCWPPAPLFALTARLATATRDQHRLFFYISKAFKKLAATCSEPHSPETCYHHPVRILASPPAPSSARWQELHQAARSCSFVRRLCPLPSAGDGAPVPPPDAFLLPPPPEDISLQSLYLQAQASRLPSVKCFKALIAIRNALPCSIVVNMTHNCSSVICSFQNIIKKNPILKLL